MMGNYHVRFGGGRSEKELDKGHLAGRLPSSVALRKPSQPERSRGQKWPKARTGATRNAVGVSMAKPRLLRPAERRLSGAGRAIGRRPMLLSGFPGAAFLPPRA